MRLLQFLVDGDLILGELSLCFDIGLDYYGAIVALGASDETFGIFLLDDLEGLILPFQHGVLLYLFTILINSIDNGEL